MNPNEKIILVDESYHEKHNFYSMSFVKMDLSKDPNFEHEFTKLKPNGAYKLHWVHADHSLKNKAVNCLKNTNALENIVVAKWWGSETHNQERMRRKTIEKGLQLDESFPEYKIIFESRSKNQDKKDIKFVRKLKQFGVIPNGIWINHEYGANNKLLSVADVCLGAFTNDILSLNNNDYFSSIDDKTTIYDVYE